MSWELGQWVQQVPKWFLDLGPGITGAEVHSAKSIWPDVQCFGLEPCLDRFHACQSDFPGRLLNLAAWDSEIDALNLYVDERANLWGLFAPKHVPVSHTVRGQTLDALSRQYGPFENSVIWADIEGAELRMLRGACELLSSGAVLALNLEVRPTPYADGWCVEDEVDEFLADYGFSRARNYCERGRGHHYDVIYIPRSMSFN